MALGRTCTQQMWQATLRHWILFTRCSDGWHLVRPHDADMLPGKRLACLSPAPEAWRAVQGAVTVAVRYGAMRRQFGPAGGPEISVLDYRSQQEKLMPLLASAFGIHFTTRFLVTQYAEAKRTKEEDVIADVHALSAGEPLPCTHCCVVICDVVQEAAISTDWLERDPGPACGPSEAAEVL